MGLIFFRALDPIFWALNEDNANFMCFDIVNIYKVFLPDRTIRVPCILQLRCRF